MKNEKEQEEARLVLTMLFAALLIAIVIILWIYIEGYAANEPITQCNYESMSVPDGNTSFKTWEDYRTITDRSSDQYKFIQTWGWLDCDGFMRCNGERDLGIDDDYYLVALGSFYGTRIGDKYKITTDTGRVFYVALGDQKADRDTNSTHQYASERDVLEFIVDRHLIPGCVRISGSANTYMKLNGSVAGIERIEFE